jgi:anti-sigma B factor antagonist
MGLEISKREIEGILVCDLNGAITAGDSAATLRSAVKDMNEGGRNRAVINLKQVDFIDSTGLGTLILAHSTLKSGGGALKLANLSKRHIELLIITKLSTIFELFNDETDAVNSFFPNRHIQRFDILNFVQKK